MGRRGPRACRRSQSGSALAARFLDVWRKRAFDLSSTSTGRKLRRWALLSAMSSPLCSRRSAATSSTISILFGRTWQVNLQAEAEDRRDISASRTIFSSATRRARWCRCNPSPSVRINHRTAGYRTLQQLSVGHDQRRPGVRASHPARRLRRWQKYLRRRCRPATPSNGPARLIRSRAPAVRPGSCLGWRCCSRSFFWSRLYESWVIPIPVLLSVVVGVLGAIGGVMVAKLTLRSLCANRLSGADRARRQERNSHRRIREGAATRAGTQHR